MLLPFVHNIDRISSLISVTPTPTEINEINVYDDYINHIDTDTTHLSQITSYVETHQTLIIGVMTYVGALFLLQNLEKIMNDRDNSSISKLSYEPQFTKPQIEQNFITPVTSDRPFPSLRELKIKPYYIGSRMNIKQFITLDELQEIRGVQGISKPWSELLKTKVYIYKKLDQL